MNNNNLTEEITILKTWKGEEFEIDVKYEDYLIMKTNLKQQGEDGFNSSKYRRFIKFSSIEHEIGKTKYLALEAPSRPVVEKRELTPEEREKRKELLDKIREDTKEGRKKKFVEDRAETLKRLARSEERHGIQTTIDKLRELEQFRKENIKKQSDIGFTETK